MDTDLHSIGRKQDTLKRKAGAWKPVVRLTEIQRMEAPGRGFRVMIEAGAWSLLGCPPGNERMIWRDPMNGDLCMTARDVPIVGKQNSGEFQ